MKNKKQTNIQNTKTSIMFLLVIFAFGTHETIKTSTKSQTMEELVAKDQKNINNFQQSLSDLQNSRQQRAKNQPSKTQKKQLLTFGMLAEIGEQGQQASEGVSWNFELQNKLQYGSLYGFITVQAYYYDERTKAKTNILQANLYPLQKVRAVVDLSRKILIDVLFNGKLFKTISFRSYAIKKEAPYYETIYLTLGVDGSVYPQTGVYHGLTQTTDSGLDNSQNIPASAVMYQTF